MTLVKDREIKDSYNRDGYVVVDGLLEDVDLDSMREFIADKIDRYAYDLYAKGELSSLHETEPFERRYAAICEEQGLSPRDWTFGTFGPEFYNLYVNPNILRIINIVLGDEVSVLTNPSMRAKLPNSTVAAFPWHQDSHYFDMSEVGKQEKHTESLHLITVWVPLVTATVENGCCWVIPGSHRWGLLDGVRGTDRNVRIEQDVEARGDPVAVPVDLGGALFFSNLCVHASKQNKTRGSRWSLDFRYFPTPASAGLDDQQRQAALFVESEALKGGDVPFAVLPAEERPTWPEWEAAAAEHRSRLAKTGTSIR